MKPFLLACCALGACAVLAQTPTQRDKTELINLAHMQKIRDGVKAKLDKSPHNPALRHKFVVMNDQFANATMTCDALTSHQKYAGALRIYRQSLKVDPKDPEAAKWVNEIERIYKSMHRPIPK